MKTIRSFRAKTAGLLAVPLFIGGSTGTVAQGSLLPPGPPAPMMKTLDQIEPRRLIAQLPFTITNAGSYYLTTNLTGGTAQNGIVVQADDVTIDLNGFTLSGTAGSSNGVACLAARRNLRLLNGTIRNWGANGIAAGPAAGGRFERLALSGNGSRGLVAGEQTIVEVCLITDNGADGLQVGGSSIVRGTLASQNLGSGFLLGAGSLVTDCSAQGNILDGIAAESGCRIQSSVARQNLRHGLSGTTNIAVADFTAQENESRGLWLGDGALIAKASAIANGDHGIQAERAARISDCLARSNGGDGVRTGPASEVTDSVIQGNQGRGMGAGGGSSAIRCNLSSNAGLGIEIEHTARVLDCKVQSNIPGGIFAGKASTVSHCSVLENGGDGIRVSSECLVLGNNCHGNDNVIDSAGIHATGTKNQIRDNTVTSNVRGVSLDADGNFVARNLASNNTLNYRRTSSQTMGVVLTTLDDANAVQPWANFAF